ncbi:MAG TPA: hypothetical protein VHE30_20750 [Polyangiaceae bacterium]|nr:hypothetical protein [Polyangiaceae bacterium]
MNRIVLLGMFGAWLSGCSSTVASEERAPTHVVGTDCSPETACGGCATCFDACTCGGGATARCAEECHAAAPPERKGDSGAPVSEGSMIATLVTTAFDIPAGQEYFRCQNFENPFGADVALLSTESFMTPGAHHMFVFEAPGATNGELEPCSGLEFSANVHTTQRSQERLTYPPGVGRFLSGATGLRVQIHFLNTSEETVHGEIAVTLRGDPPDLVPIHASQIFINTASISVAPRSQGSAQKDCAIPKDINVFTAASHMHQHGTYYTARSSDGQLLYETNQWAEPVPWTFTPPRKLSAGSTITEHCDYDNDTDYSLGFGESAATNEMCIFTGAYYPAADGESIVCLL